MNISFNGKHVPVFNLLGIINKADINFYSNLISFIKKTEEYRFDGILLPDSNAGILNPWFFANTVFNTSNKLIPFVAINPIYTHPFFTAKYIANLSYFSGKALFLNYITGTAVFDSLNLGDKNNHDLKYERLEEYINVVNYLLSKPENLNFDGKFYNIKNVDFSQKLEERLLPKNFVAGSSDSSLQVIKKTNASRLAMAMAPGDFEKLNVYRDYDIGFHFGIICRATDEEAESVLTAYCPENKASKKIKEYSTQKAGIVWKKELLERFRQTNANTCYNLVPFANGCSDVPYLVGSYQNVALAIYDYLVSGLSLMVIEIPDTGLEEFHHINEVFSTLKLIEKQKTK